MKPISYLKLLDSKAKNVHLITFENDENYVVKLYKENENKALINEWIGYCIARFMCLPIPYAYLTEIPQPFFDSIPEIYEAQYTSKQFASKFLTDSVNANETKVKNIVNTSDLANIIVFDYWLCNTDRTRNNVLLKETEPGSHFLWIIDQAKLFSSQSWTINDLENLPQTLFKSATHKLMAKFVQSEKEFKKAVQIIQSMPTQLLEEILSFIPEDWNLTSEEKEEMIRTLNYRRYNSLPTLIGKFIKHVYYPLQV